MQQRAYAKSLGKMNGIPKLGAPPMGNVKYNILNTAKFVKSPYAMGKVTPHVPRNIKQLLAP